MGFNDFRILFHIFLSRNLSRSNNPRIVTTWIVMLLIKSLLLYQSEKNIRLEKEVTYGRTDRQTERRTGQNLERETR